MPLVVPTLNPEFDRAWSAYERQARASVRLAADLSGRAWDEDPRTVALYASLAEDLPVEPPIRVRWSGPVPQGEPIPIPGVSSGDAGGADIQARAARLQAAVCYAAASVLRHELEPAAPHASSVGRNCTAFGQGRAAAAAMVRLADDLDVYVQIGCMLTGAVLSLDCGHAILWRQPWASRHPRRSPSWRYGLGDPDVLHREFFSEGGLYADVVRARAEERHYFGRSALGLTAFASHGPDHALVRWSKSTNSPSAFVVGDPPFYTSSRPAAVVRRAQLGALRLGRLVADLLAARGLPSLAPAPPPATVKPATAAFLRLVRPWR